MYKERIKGAVMGFMLCAVLTVGIMAVNAQTIMREITYGVNVMLNGQAVNFDADTRPFTMGGRTFLPLRTIAELMDLPVDFNAATNTAILGRAETRRGTSVSELFYDGSSTYRSGSGAVYEGRGTVEFQEVAIMGGNTYQNAVVFNVGTSWYNAGLYTQAAMLNLNARYNWIEMDFGRVDGSASIGTTVNIYFDDRLVESFEQNAQSLPKEIRLFVEGIKGVKVEVITSMPENQAITYAFSGFAE
ncbi:MAG: copper amine oxidase N-terminal domain-containing protein [Defluviitaleaceae bacterium]|nr:copper amine oxidase N-terminal domain-containing protein [Defluviitaleaceae bacterium]